MLRRLALVLCVAFAALLPATASANSNRPPTQIDVDRGGFALTVHGSYVLGPNEGIGSVVVIRGDAVIAGTVHHRLVVIDGNADIAGRVDGGVTIVRGTITLEGGSHVNRVTIIRGTVNRQSGSVVDHGINRRGLGFFRGAVFWLLWLGMTLAVVIGGLVFAAIGGRQLAAASAALTGKLAHSILGAVVIWIGLPALALLAVITVVGIPFGLALLLIVPLLWLLGYIVAGARLGVALLSLGGNPKPVDHPYVAVALGLIILQIVVLVPILGWAIGLIAGIWGSGALAVGAFDAWRRGSSAREGVVA